MGRRLVVRLRDGGGRPPAQARVVARPVPTKGAGRGPQPSPQEASARSDGRAFLWLPVGAYELQIRARTSDGRAFDRKVRVVLKHPASKAKPKPQELEVPLERRKR